MGSLEPCIDQQVIDDLIHSRLQLFRKTPYGRGNDIPFFIADTSKVFQQHRRWKQALPYVHPFYAVKCNPDRKLLQLLADMGVNFDCASLQEIEQVLDMGVDPSRIIFAHPCKSPSALHIASKRGIRLTTFDNADELDKIEKICPNMDLLLRIHVEDLGSKVALGTKFGAPMEVTGKLLRKARLLGLNILGVSFHIGSGSSNPQAFIMAVQQAKIVFEDGKELGFDMHTLDIGGGFEDDNFEDMAYPLREAIACEFRDPITLIAEPGRFYASGFYTMVCQVIARRVQVDKAEIKLPDMLYLNDGLYGCFSMGWSENGVFVPTLIDPHRVPNMPPRDPVPHVYSVWGPTCDSIDCISKEVVLNQEVRVGDWLKFEDMGAYTISASSRFNGFSNSYTVIYME